MNHESDLSRRLSEVASSVQPRADLAAVERRARRVRSRRRLATGVVAAMLVAAAGGVGFGIGRSAGRSGGEVTTAAVPTDTTPTTNGDTSPDDRDDAEARAIAEAERVQAEAEADTRAGEEVSPGGRPLPSVVADVPGEDRHPQSDLVYERSTDDGSYFRVTRISSWDTGEQGYYPELPDWQPAPFCFGSGELRVGFTSPDVIDVSGAEWFETPYNGTNVSMLDVGWADGRPTRVALVQTISGATSARIVWDDGATDETNVVDGYAVLRSPGSDAHQDPYTIELTGPNGTESLTSDQLDRFRDPDYRDVCEPPPPALPDAGEQPADAATAEAEVRANFLLLVDQSVPADLKPDNLVDDPTGVDEAIAVAREGGLGEEVSSATYSIDELVFTSPTEAWFRYSIQTLNGLFTPRYGTAHLNDGVWQISRAVICADLGLAGAACEPYADEILPPSWYERYGDVNVEPGATVLGGD